MKKLEVKIWAVLAAVFAVLGGACLTWEPIRFGAAFLGALAVGCTGEAFMVAFAEKYPLCLLFPVSWRADGSGPPAFRGPGSSRQTRTRR